jgi:hypothetical protein
MFTLRLRRLSLSRAILIAGFVLLLGAAPLRTWAWGDRGHEAIATVASGLLQPATKARLARILGHMTLPQAATWPDHIRPEARLAHTDEAVEFNRKFPDNGTWHYVNLPLGTVAFPKDHRLVHRRNIVEQIGACIDVLEGRSRRMLPRHALCWLAHLVGDLHQPLHVGCGFFTFDPSGQPILITRPEVARPDQHDRGANQILLPGNRRLHGYWDGEMVRTVWEAQPGARLEDLMRETIQAGGMGAPAGPVSAWPRAWALESVVAARQVYEGVSLGRKTGTAESWQIPATWAASEQSYKRDHVELARRQLANAAFHLAELLNRLRWK